MPPGVSGCFELVLSGSNTGVVVTAVYWDKLTLLKLAFCGSFSLPPSFKREELFLSDWLFLGKRVNLSPVNYLRAGIS
jgi:hypothetical protein